MENDYKIYGYDVKDLVVVAEMVKKCNIYPDQLTKNVEMFKLGYQLCEKHINEVIRSEKERYQMRIEEQAIEFYEELKNKKEKGI